MQKKYDIDRWDVAGGLFGLIWAIFTVVGWIIAVMVACGIVAAIVLAIAFA